MKFNRLHSLFLLFALSCMATAQAQSVKGKWYGVGNVGTSSNTNNYLCELVLEQKGNVVTGEFNYFFRNGYFSNKIKGNYNADTRQLKLNFTPIIFYKTVDAAMGVDCMMQGIFTLKASRAESTLTGSFVSDELHAYTAAPINIKFTKLLKEIPFKQLVETEIENENRDTLVRPAESPRMKLEREASIQLNMRTKEIVKELDVSEDSVRVDLYDNGDFDHDSISVFYNGRLIQHQQLLETRKPISFKVYVDSISANNDLVMYAENLGTIPPNSALMVITDKDHRYEINLTSNYQKNAAVRLRRIGSR